MSGLAAGPPRWLRVWVASGAPPRCVEPVLVFTGIKSHLAAAWPRNVVRDEALGSDKVEDKAEIVLVESSRLRGLGLVFAAGKLPLASSSE